MLCPTARSCAFHDSDKRAERALHLTLQPRHALALRPPPALVASSPTPTTQLSAMPTLAHSLYERHDGYAFAYKVLGRSHKATPLVLVHGCVLAASSFLLAGLAETALTWTRPCARRLSAVGLVDWFPLADALAAHRPGASTLVVLLPHIPLVDPLELTHLARAVLVFDNRGIGGSTIPAVKSSEPYDIYAMAADVVDLVKVRRPPSPPHEAQS